MAVVSEESKGCECGCTMHINENYTFGSLNCYVRATMAINLLGSGLMSPSQQASVILTRRRIHCHPNQKPVRTNIVYSSRFNILRIPWNIYIADNIHCLFFYLFSESDEFYEWNFVSFLIPLKNRYNCWLKVRLRHVRRVKHMIGNWKKKSIPGHLSYTWLSPTQRNSHLPF